MSMLASGDARRFESDELAMSASFLAQHSSYPPSPSPYEQGRRDSLVSTQSPCSMSFSSKYSAHNDQSIPATPTYAQSPAVSQNDYVEIASFDRDTPMHPMHSMPLAYQQREYPSADDMCAPWAMVPPTTMESPFTPFPASGVDQSVQMHMANVPSSATHWSPMTAWHDSRRTGPEFTPEHHQQGSLSPVSMGGFQEPWDQIVPSSFDSIGTIHTETMMQSESMMEEYDDDAYDSAPSHGDDKFSQSSHSQLKCEDDDDYKMQRTVSLPYIQQTPCGPRFDQSYACRGPSSSSMPEGSYTRSTGAKGLKGEEYRSRSVSTKKKPSRRYTDFNGVKIEVISTTLYACEYPHCPKKFKRTEHLKRHLRIHSPYVAARCDICPKGKGFNRNDNYIAHCETHISRPGKKDGKNQKMPLDKLLLLIKDPKIVEKLRQKFPHLLDPRAKL